MVADHGPARGRVREARRRRGRRRSCERARGAAARALKAAAGHNCLAVFAAADGTLSITIGDETISQPLS